MEFDPFIPEELRERIRAGRARYFRRKKAAGRALLQRNVEEAKAHKHVPVTITIPSSETERGTVLDEIQELRCEGCPILLGFAA